MAAVASTTEILLAARRIADRAKTEGALVRRIRGRVSCTHMGAVLADAVLQAGLNYNSVVRPRVERIIRKFPEMDNISNIIEMTLRGETGVFLDWTHQDKINRFHGVVYFLRDKRVETILDLSSFLKNRNFKDDLLDVNGVGRKTVDYLSCLVGIDSFAVDRHVRKFAKRVGVPWEDYDSLHMSFCFAADLLELPRRDFDAWLWQKETDIASKQLSLAI